MQQQLKVWSNFKGSPREKRSDLFLAHRSGGSRQALTLGKTFAILLERKLQAYGLPCLDRLLETTKYRIESFSCNYSSKAQICLLN